MRAIKLLVLMGLVLAVPASQAPADEKPAGVSGLFDHRYCEVLTIARKRLKLDVTVYNTLGFNECPDAQWKALDARQLAKQFNVQQVKLNGPRHWLIDGIIGKGMSMTNHTETFGEIEMAERAHIELNLLDGIPGNTFYKPGEVHRETIFTFKAGEPVFELTDPDGHVYMMQAYSQIVDPKLSLEALKGLGTRLKLPRGWTYSTRILDADYRLEAKGTAYVVQDELQNTYQRRP
jgi:hypothetical protein